MTHVIRPLLAATALCVALAAGPATAQSCPTADADAATKSALHELLRSAPTAAAAQPINRQLWDLWIQAPDSIAQEYLDFGLARLRVSDFEAAIGAFDRLIDYCPAYAEGYNQRAYANYLRQDYAPALVDLDLALEREPRHVGALSGRALTLMGLGRDAEALTQLEAAVLLHPWLNERHLIPVLKERLGAEDI